MADARRLWLVAIFYMREQADAQKAPPSDALATLAHKQTVRMSRFGVAHFECLRSGGTGTGNLQSALLVGFVLCVRLGPGQLSWRRRASSLLSVCSNDTRRPRTTQRLNASAQKVAQSGAKATFSFSKFQSQTFAYEWRRLGRARTAALLASLDFFARRT